MHETNDPQKRFSFGKNWARFLENLNEDRILEAEKSLKEKTRRSDFKDQTFLDIGSGSGLFSLAAYRLGAKVHSFDYDQESVACTQYLRETYAPKTDRWVVQQGSVLDTAFLKKMGPFDVVYSWGVLHHTGHMYQAFENASKLVKANGTLFISIYNHQGRRSKIWWKIKKTYTDFPLLRKPLVFVCGLWLWKYNIAWSLVRHGNPFKLIVDYGKNNRGMSAWHDLVDWVGGYPFEVAKPEDVFDFFKSKGFHLQTLKTCGGGLGCNEFVFVKTPLSLPGKTADPQQTEA